MHDFDLRIAVPRSGSVELSERNLGLEIVGNSTSYRQVSDLAVVQCQPFLCADPAMSAEIV